MEFSNIKYSCGQYKNTGLLTSSIFDKKFRSLCKNDDDPFIVCDIGDVIHKWLTWKSILPNVKPFYAVKCNSRDEIICLLHKLGCGFDCATEREIELVISHGVSGDDIIFANTIKPISHIKFAAKNKVSLMTFDNEDELYKIAEHYPQAKLVMRINTKGKHKQFVYADFNEKYGCLVGLESRYLLQKAKTLGLNIHGISFHVGILCTSCLMYKQALEYCMEIINQAETIGHDIKMIDIGGGFPGSKVRDAQIFNDIKVELLKFPKDLEFIAEPGRYLVYSAYSILTPIVGKKLFFSEEQSQAKYYLNQSTHSLFNLNATLGILDVPYPLAIKSKQENTKENPSILYGLSCSFLDVIRENILLPELTIGDWIVFPNFGSYTFPFQTTFNGIAFPKVYIIADEDTFKILQSNHVWDEKNALKNISKKRPLKAIDIVSHLHTKCENDTKSKIRNFLSDLLA